MGNLVKVNFKKESVKQVERIGFNEKWIELLTLGNLDLFESVRKTSKSESIAIMEIRRKLIEIGRGQDITVDQLVYGNIREESYLQRLLQELFLEPISINQIGLFYELANERGYKDTNSAMKELYNRHFEDKNLRFLSIALTL